MSEVAVWKKLVALAFVVLAVVVAFTAFRTRAPSGASDAPSSSASAPSASSASGDAPLTALERSDMGIKLPLEECQDAQKRIIALNDPVPHDPKSARLFMLCQRHGNVAWYKCIRDAKNRQDVASCTRRLMLNE
jgi:hypothetical protein